jgi:hypothetical protein
MQSSAPDLSAPVRAFHILLVSSALLASTGTARAADVLDITEGTMELGGSATVSVQAIEDSVAFGVTLAPQFGYFVTDVIQINGAVGLSVSAFETFTTTSVSLAPGIQAVFPGQSVRPFLGASLLFTSYSFDGEGASTLGVAVPVGVLVPLSDAVAISIGTQPSVVANIDGGPAIISVPAGALGVRSFFR